MTVAHHQRTEEAANRLWIAASTQRPCSPVRDLIGSDDIALAYAVQEFNVRRRITAGARPAGRKIGMTSVAVQKQLGCRTQVNRSSFAHVVPLRDRGGFVENADTSQVTRSPILASSMSAAG